MFSSSYWLLNLILVLYYNTVTNDTFNFMFRFKKKLRNNKCYLINSFLIHYLCCLSSDLVIYLDYCIYLLFIFLSLFSQLFGIELKIIVYTCIEFTICLWCYYIINNSFQCFHWFLKCNNAILYRFIAGKLRTRIIEIWENCILWKQFITNKP